MGRQQVRQLQAHLRIEHQQAISRLCAQCSSPAALHPPILWASMTRWSLSSRASKGRPGSACRLRGVRLRSACCEGERGGRHCDSLGEAGKATPTAIECPKNAHRSQAMPTCNVSVVAFYPPSP